MVLYTFHAVCRWIREISSVSNVAVHVEEIQRLDASLEAAAVY